MKTSIIFKESENFDNFFCNSVHYGPEFYTAGGEKEVSLAEDRKQAQAMVLQSRKHSGALVIRKQMPCFQVWPIHTMDELDLLLIKSRVFLVLFIHSTSVC